ncbi:MAG: histidine phosphatase family protein [Caldilineaceae bacterium]|nr:histidine phosphatase family protein [Caldilineaceae bacterium]
MTRLILLRHGETMANVEKIWHGALDAPLTQVGEAQVAAATQRLLRLHADSPIDHIYVSPLPRAQRTAHEIAGSIGLDLRVDDGLSEMSIGDWEGRTFAHLRDVDRLWERWSADPSFTPPNGESPLSFGRRVPAAFLRLSEAHPSETLLIVTHGGVISNLLAQWLGDGPQDWARWDPANCAISVLDRVDDGWTPTLVNDVAHLAGVGHLPGDWFIND